MENLLQTDRENIWHPFTPLKGQSGHRLIERAKGVYLYQDGGDKILDAVSSWWVSIHGHGNDHIADAVGHQVREMEHVIFAGFTHRPAIKLSQNLLTVLPNNQQKIFFSDNGSTSVEVAIKMAFQYWYNKDIKKEKVIAIEGAYHGDTFGSMSVGERGGFNIPFEPYLFPVDFIPFPNGENDEIVISRFRDLVKKGDVASFIFEPLIQGSAGMRMYSAETLEKLLQIAKESEVICIADEVMTGFGRTGKMFATDYLDTAPDIFCLSKGLTGGTMPMGITTASAEIVQAFDTREMHKTFFHGHSYTGNPIACAAANASFELTQRPEFFRNIERISARHQEFRGKISSHNMVKQVRVLGTVLAIELNLGDTSYMNKSRNALYQFFLDRNILMRPLGNIIYILPPFIISDQELETVYSAILELLDQGI